VAAAAAAFVTVITVDLMITKDFITYSIKILRQEKNLRDHGGGAG
jgi:hypothetical protein